MHPIIKSRFEQFSDGVFAIAITLLALELRIPTLIASRFSESLKEIIPLVPMIITFALSFVTIAIFWVNHHQLTQMIDTIKQRRILWSNIVFLLFLTLIPFATQAVSANPLHPLAMFTYSLICFGASISFTVLRFFIHRDIGEDSVAMGRSFVGPVCYLFAIGTALYAVEFSYFFLAIPALFYFLPKDHGHY